MRDFSSFHESIAPPEASRFSHVVFAGDASALQPEVRPLAPPPPTCGAPLPEIADPEYARLFQWLCRQRGLGADHYRASIVRRRRGACLRAVRAASIDDAHARAAGSPELVDRALAAVLIGVTSFFRDAAPFHALSRELARPDCALNHRPLTVLSVACSDGPEVYSTGIVLAEAGLLDRSTLWGIDCRPAAIESARAGEYPLSALAPVTAERRLRWFSTENRRARVKPLLRARARWIVGDAFSFSEPALADIILCRNFVIYLQPDAARDVWRSLVARLRPGGLLIVGKAERPWPLHGLARVGPCLYRKMECTIP